MSWFVERRQREKIYGYHDNVVVFQVEHLSLRQFDNEDIPDDGRALVIFFLKTPRRTS